MTNGLLLKSIPYEEFDYQTLLDAVRVYARPRMKISAMLTKGDIIRVKKGLYVLGESLRRRPYCRELLGNLIYGPSYVSLEYALNYHGLTPERVETVTSVTCGRSRNFDTPVGAYSYRMIPLAAFRIGMDRIELTDGRSFLIAIPEKALADRVVADRGSGISTWRELRCYLTDDLRIDADALCRLDPAKLTDIARLYRSRKLKLLAGLISRMGKSAVKPGTGEL
ncbi:MAG: hypothetical protein WCP20_13325 [Desulfuromonadales bacterium]